MQRSYPLLNSLHVRSPLTQIAASLAIEVFRPAEIAFGQIDNARPMECAYPGQN